MNRRAAMSCLVLSTALGLHLDAHAQSATQRAAADALFEEGIQLRNGGDHVAACDRFKKSQALDPARGTLQNIGMCLEEQGKVVSALNTFQELLDQAEQARDGERIRVARSKLKALRPRVPKLQITVAADSKIPGLEILLNDEVVQAALLGFAAPVDPGSYTIEARAPNHQSFTTSIVLAEAQVQQVTIPKLVPAPVTDAQDGRTTGELTTTNPTLTTDAGVTGSGVGIGAQSGPAKDSLGSVAVTIGPSFFTVGDEDSSPQAAFGVEAGWRALAGDSALDVGALVAYTSSPWTADAMSGTTQLVSLLANATYSKALTSKWRFRAQGGAGALVLLGLDEPGNPLVQPGIRSEGAVILPHLRVALGIEFAATDSLQILVSPVVLWLSPGLDEFAMGVDTLTGLQSMAGVGFLF